MKSYKQFCGVAKALDIVGERWTLLIVRDCLLGSRTYTDLLHGLSGITSNLLAKRLRELTESGVMERTPGAQRRYRLTPQGQLLEPVILGLGAFGAGYMNAPADDERTDPLWVAVSLKRRYLGSKGAGSVVIRLGEDAFFVEFGGAHIQVSRHAEQRSDVSIKGEFLGWFPLLSRRSGLAELEQAGLLSHTGKKTLAQTFVRSIGLLA